MYCFQVIFYERLNGNREKCKLLDPNQKAGSISTFKGALLSKIQIVFNSSLLYVLP